jgi:hypothetical protein
MCMWAAEGQKIKELQDYVKPIADVITQELA